MKHRSWLIVPGNDEERLALAMGTGADVVVVDLEATVAEQAKHEARGLAREWLSLHRQNVLEHRGMGRWVRINALGSGHSREDLLTVMPAAPDGVILPASAGPDALLQLASEIYELEQEHGIPANSTRIMPVVGESPRAAMRIADYLETPHQRLHGITWSASGLAAAMGCTRPRARDGGWSDAFRLVRAQALLMAHGGGIMAIDAPFEAFEDEEGLARAAGLARAEGFAGMFAVHPGQIGTINAAFAPGDDELADARELVACFEENPLAGLLAFKGRMVDRSHLAAARRTIETGEGAALAEAQRRYAILRPA